MIFYSGNLPLKVKKNAEESCQVSSPMSVDNIRVENWNSCLSKCIRNYKPRANSTDILGWEFQFPLILKFNKRLYFNLSFILMIYMSFFLQINFNFWVFFLLELAEENDQNSLLNIFSYDLRVESLLKVKIWIRK